MNTETIKNRTTNEDMPGFSFKDFMPSGNFIRGNRVYILGDFDETISIRIIPDLLELIDNERYVKDAYIEIYINSRGGYAQELLGLLSVISMGKASGIRFDTYNIGYAYSCGSLLSVIGDRRYMYKYASNLPHLGQACMCPQTMTQLTRGTKNIGEWFSYILDIYEQNTKLSKSKLEKMLSDDGCFLNAEECMKYGFCDAVI